MLLDAVVDEPPVTLVAGSVLIAESALASAESTLATAGSVLIAVPVLILVAIVVAGRGDARRGHGVSGGQAGRQRSREQGDHYQCRSEFSAHIDHSSYRCVHQYDP